METAKDVGEEIARLDRRIEELKKTLEAYLTLGNEFARASLITSLRKI